MLMVSSNRLLPLLAGVVMVLMVFVVVQSCSEGQGDTSVLTAIPQAPEPDADTPADTIKTLTANVSAMTIESRALRRDNAVLKQENQSLLKDRSQIENNVFSRLQKTMQAKELAKSEENNQSSGASMMSALTARVDALAQSLSDRQRYLSEASNSSDIPVGLGLDGLSSSPQSVETLVWVESLEKTVGAPAEDGNLLSRFGRSTKSTLTTVQPRGEALLKSGAKAINSAIPVYTVPRNATLIGSTAMTALVGRVPVQGQVHDPMPFKVLVGKDNLAANGLKIPGLQGMVWSGTAIGDWTLSCVSGQLESVTFVFQDGTIQTISSDDNSSGSSGTASRGGKEKSLGWISDARGIPCITGARKTNAPAFLTQRIGASAMEAAASAAAQSETTTLLSDSGSVSNTVTGQAGKYILGKTLSGSSQEIAEWLRERQAQSFDAIFVPAGIELAIHVDHELPIDFHTNGRKLYHANSTNLSTRTRRVPGLD
jgi:cell division protein ZapB